MQEYCDELPLISPQRQANEGTMITPRTKWDSEPMTILCQQGEQADSLNLQ